MFHYYMDNTQCMIKARGAVEGSNGQDVLSQLYNLDHKSLLMARSKAEGLIFFVLS